MNKEMHELIIDFEFRDLIPPLAEDELALLEESIVKNGCEIPLVTWNGVIVDGHNRYSICKKHDIPFAVRVKAFADRDEALLWIITNQLGRRNLTSYQKGVLALKFEPLLKAQAKERQIRKPGTDVDVPQNSAGQKDGETRQKLAGIAGVSHDTIKKVKKLTESADAETKQMLQRGEVSINKAYTELMHREHADETRTCDRCGQEKPITEFSIPSNRQGFSSLCRVCEKRTPQEAREAADTANRAAEPVQTIPSVAMHKGHPIHVAAPLPDRPDMFPYLEDHMRFIVGNFLAAANNAMQLYTQGMESPANTKALREILETAGEAVATFDKYVKEILEDE